LRWRGNSWLDRMCEGLMPGGVFWQSSAGRDDEICGVRVVGSCFGRFWRSGVGIGRHDDVFRKCSYHRPYPAVRERLGLLP
jgi:hypothetical protein